MLEVITLFLFNIIVYNIPLLYGTTGEIMIEKSGSLNLGVPWLSVRLQVTLQA